MFDQIKSSCDIGGFTNAPCQTKDIDEMNGTLAFYWVDPLGYLWTSDYAGTRDIKWDDGDENLWSGMKFVKNGNHGRFHRVYLTKAINIYPEDMNLDEGWVDCRLNFADGHLQGYEYINKNI